MESTKIELKKSGVVFTPETHEYRLNGKELVGVTGIIKNHAMAGSYVAIPERFLKVRAEFGNRFHEDMSLYISTGIKSDSDVFKVFMENYSDIRFTHTEYLVTDYERIASAIDAIDEDMVLYDFKTSTKTDMEYWRWQMSTYRWLFKEVNGFYPKGLKVIWINKDCKHGIYDIEPIDEEVVKRMFATYFAGEPFEDVSEVNTELSVNDSRFEELAMLEKAIVEMETKVKEIEAKRDKVKAIIYEGLLQAGIKSWKTDKLSITLKDSYLRKSFDSSALFREHPELKGKYEKETEVKGSMTIRLLQ